MNWLRWHHGTVTDPKFAIVAQRAETTRANVISVWAYLLETASQADERGNVTRRDAEETAVTLDLKTTLIEAIFEAMQSKGLIENGHLAAWSRRQPKREDSSRERTRAYRAKKTPVTQRDAPVTHGDARGEEILSKSLPQNDGFDVWWKHVPRKVGKKDAEKAFRAALKKTDFDTLDAAIKKYTESVKGKDPEFIAHPATWLNGERWNDEPPPRPKEPWECV